MVYVGQGRIAARLSAHLAKGSDPSHRQVVYFSGKARAPRVELPSMPAATLLEHEKDLVAVHMLTTGVRPTAQFLG